jgi:Protein of unknown function (DUF4199)
MKISPTIKGLITSALMIGVVLGIYYYRDNADTRLQYLIYALYALGIAWTVIAYRQSDAFTGKFGDVFSKGFRCFIIVILAMAVFLWIFNTRHPEFAEESAKYFRESMQKDNSKLPDQLESAVAIYKKQYTLIRVSGAIFGYLIIGAGVTAALSALLTRRK